MILNYSKKQFFMIAIFSLFTFLSLPHSSFGQFNSVDLHSQVTQVQPMTGIVFWSENSGDLNTLGNKVQLEYSYLVYSDVIQNQGAYNWSIVDELLADAAANGRQMIIRFRYTYPGKTIPSVPAYIRNRNDYNDANRIFSVEGSSTYIPDWSSQSLQVFTKEFFTAFAARYDNDSRLAFLQIGFGSYSEYHLYGYNGQAIADGLFPSKSYQIEFLNHVNGLFQQTQWGISIDAASSDYTPIGSAGLQSLNYGLFDDSFLHADHSSSNSEYNRSSWLFFGQNKYQTNAAGGELSYYDGEQPLVLNPNGTNGTSFEQLAAQYHISYMIGNDQLNYQSASRIESAGRAIGYRFSVEGYETNGSMTNVTIRNTGIAPIYYDAYPAIGGVRSNSSLKGLLPNQAQVFTISSAATGEDLTIECDRLSPSQVIQFNANIDGNGGNGGNTCITIDQSLNDWSTIATLSSNAGFILKAADDNNTLYISVSGTIGDDGNGYQIFLDTDNSGSGFTYYSSWAQTGFDAMIENGSFSRYIGSGSDWLWSAETPITSSKTTLGLELKIDKSLLNANSSNIRIGFASLSNWGGVAFVPTGSTASAYAMSSALNCGACNIAQGTPCNDDNICTTGDVYDANCNCVGTFQDADSDGICDANDSCPNLNNALIGQACDDGNDCTSGETYDTNCGCTGGTDTCNGAETTIYYTPNDNENIVNPDRGFYLPIYPPAKMGDNNAPLNEADLASKRQSFNPGSGANYEISTALFYRYYVLDRNADYNAVANFGGSIVQQDFDALRRVGGRLIVRFAYITDKRPECPGDLPCSPYLDAPMPNVVIDHIRALKQVLQDNEDVISVVQIGFIGVWGEQFYTDNFAENSLDVLTVNDWTNRNNVVKELLDAVPSSRMVQIRYPQMKQKYLSGPSAVVAQSALNSIAMTDADAYTGTDKARLGLHNDCFLVDATDSGTYKDYGPNPINQSVAATTLKAYAINESKYTPVGGETCFGALSSFNTCENAKKDMEDLHFSYLNSGWYNPINNQWTNTCMPEIKRRLGYRFVMQSGTYPTTASLGSTIPITLKVSNEGYAAPYNERELWLVFRGPGGTKKAKINGSNIDTRRWYPGNVATVTGNVTVPVDLSNGNYEILLHILDPSSGGRIAERSEYSIQLANAGTWEESTGFNKLNHTIAIGGTPPPSSGCITIDQSLNDWQTISTLSSNAGLTIKAADDNSALYISVTGNIGPYYQIFLDTDNNNSGSNEFLYFGAWSQTGFNAMIENGLFSRYTGTGSDWLWSTETPLTHERTSAGFELKIDKSLLNASSSTIRIGFASLDNTWTGVDFAPAGSSAAAYTLASSLNCNTCPDSDNDGVCDSEDACPGIDDAIIGMPCSDNDICTTGETYNANCNCTGGTSQDADQDGVCAALDPNDNDPCVPNSCNECIVIDQSLNDWSTIAPLSANGNFTLKAADDNNTLYISVTGTIGDFGNGYQIFIDTDNDNSGANEFAYFSAWSQTRFNAMIENGSFSSYTGTGSDWLWSAETPTINSKTTAGVELKIDKSLLNTNSSVIRIGFASLSNWGGVAFVPAGSTAVAYTMSSALNCGDTCPDSDGDSVCDNEDACPGIDDGLIGTPCNDNDACTTGDIYNANCSCEGTFQDADSDGVCNVNDVCPGMNDALIGTACDDGDDCTAGEIYDTNCNCTGGTYICNNDCITIDGDLSDWSTVPVLAANGLTLKAADDNNTFYMYIVGNIGPNYAIFLDTNNSSTGYSNTGWGQTAFNFMIENGTLYAYTGSGTDWLWSPPIAQLNVNRIASGVELEVDKALLGSYAFAVNLGFVSMDVNWSEVAAVPTGNAAAHTLSSSLNCGDDCPDADGDGICAGNDPNDNDPCAPNSCNTCNIFDSQNFDTNWGIWNDGGSDAYRYTGYANSGTRSIRLRDNSGSASSIYTNALDLSAVNSVNVSFSYITNSMDNSNEDFFFEISTDGGSSYTIIEEWNLNDEFVNGTRYNETVTMTTYEENFTNNTVFRFRCDASGNGDQVYIDDVVIEACGGTISLAKEEVSASLSAKLYPNPARDILNIDFENAIDQEGIAHIFTTSGQLVNQQNIPSNIHNMTIPIDRLPAGVYIIRLQFDNGLYSTQRFVKLAD